MGRSVVGNSKGFQSISSRRLASSSSRGTASSKGGSAWSCDGDWSWSEGGAEVTGESVGGFDLCIEKRSGDSSVLSVSTSNLEKKSLKSSWFIALRENRAKVVKGPEKSFHHF